MKLKLTQIAALVICLVLVNVTIAFATQIDLIFNNQVVGSATLNASKFFDKNLEVNNNSLHISISSKSGYVLTSILLFLCKDKTPEKCDLSNPIEYEKSVNTNFKLDDISTSGIANIFSLLRVNESWIGGWDSVENSVWKTQDLDKLNLYLKYDVAGYIKNIIENFGSIPFNSLEKADFLGKTLYSLEGKKSSGLFKKEKINITDKKITNTVDPKKGYAFVLPADNKIYNPITFFETPELCGNTKCDIGETYNTCWQDCACPEGQAPTPQGCIPKSNITLVIDSVNKDEFSCFIPPDIQAFKTTGGCIFTDDFQVKLHINNTPISYSLNSPYFYLGDKTYDVNERGYCQPEAGEGYQILENNFSTTPTIVYNASRFTCSIYFPSLDRDQEFNERLAVSLVLPITFSRGNETETQELTAITGINVKGTSLRLDLSELRSLDAKRRELASQQRKLNNILEKISYAELAAEAVSAAIDGCCASVIGSAICCGQVSWWTLAVLALHGANIGLEKYIDDKYDKKKDEILAYANAQVQESAQQARLEVAENIPNLVWVNGDKSGQYTGSVCGQENVEVWYNFEAFGCSQRDGLWFNFNNITRPKCDCQQFEWVGTNIEGSICDCNHVSKDFSWIKKDEGGKEIGLRRYNPTGKHLLLNTTADKLFKSNNILNITTFCATGIPTSTYGFNFGGNIGDVTAEWELANYTSTCQ